MSIMIENSAGRVWDGDGWVSDRGDAVIFASVADAEVVIERQRRLPSVMAGGSAGFEVARAVSVDTRPASADVLAYMARHGVSQDEAVRCLGGEV